MNGVDPRERDLVKCEDMQLITGMRNVLAHEYGTIVLDRVYEVVTVHIPILIDELEVLVSSLEAEVNWRSDDPERED